MIPPFDHNLVLPPHIGDPRVPSDLSPYPCSSLEVCERFATSSERVKILEGFLKFRIQLNDLGLMNGFQWLDGSFLEDVETRERRPPNDLDLVTIYWGYDINYQNDLNKALPEFSDPSLCKNNFFLDHYPVDAGYLPWVTVEYTKYWIQLFAHNRDSVWKGLLRVELNTRNLDLEALEYLKTKK